MELSFSAFVDDDGGDRWARSFAAAWPSYRRWYLSEGDAARPSYLECERAIERHVPELAPTWRRLVERAGGSDLQARFLSLWRPPPYAIGCSQAVWDGADEPLLVRNYDYSPALFEAIVLRTRWSERAVLGLSDCLIGLLDGVNDAGLAVSLAFGGRRVEGPGFGAQLVVRYVLETCDTTPQAVAALRRVRTHCAYNFTVLDRQGEFVTVHTGPDGPVTVRRIGISTNHQERVQWARHARVTETIERENHLFALLADPSLDTASFVDAFLRAPLYSTRWSRGFGTLYTAAYRPRSGRLDLHWPGSRWRHAVHDVRQGEHVARLELPTTPSPDALAADG